MINGSQKKLTKKQFNSLILKAYKSTPAPKSVELARKWTETHGNDGMFMHWNNMWAKNSQLLSNKKVLDIGISAGIHNYVAQEVFNTKTIIAVDPYKPYHNIVKSLLPDCKLYNVVDEAPNGVKVDIILLSAVLLLLGKHWKKFLKQIVDTFKFDHMIIRDAFTFPRNHIWGSPREYSLVPNFTYTNCPTVKEILKELHSNQLNVVKQYQITSYSLMAGWVFVVDNKQRSL
jgi:hypothetical protein